MPNRRGAHDEPLPLTSILLAFLCFALTVGLLAGAVDLTPTAAAPSGSAVPEVQAVWGQR